MIYQNSRLVNKDLKVCFNNDSEIVGFIKSTRKLVIRTSSESNDGMSSRTVDYMSGHQDWHTTACIELGINDVASSDIELAKVVIEEAMIDINKKKEVADKVLAVQESIKDKLEIFKAVAEEYFAEFAGDKATLRRLFNEGDKVSVSYQLKGSWNLEYIKVETIEELENEIIDLFA